jgi:molecular chaperone DnaK (HSP70)
MPPRDNKHQVQESGNSKKDGNTIIVGIDFGTTYSGVAFASSKKIDLIEIVTSWESDLPNTSEEVKVPTVIAHSGGNVTWGYSVPVDVQAVRWFKLLLIDSKDLSDDVRDSDKLKQARDALRKQNRTPMSVIAEYLRHLWQHCEKRIGESISRRLVKYSRFHVVITVPAIWPQYARSRMREAARCAGILDERIAGPTQLDIISEPEAAALATLRDLQDRCDIEVRSPIGDTSCIIYSSSRGGAFLTRQLNDGVYPRLVIVLSSLIAAVVQLISSAMRLSLLPRCL